MATLKISTIYDNTIWLTNVKTVETLVYAYTKEFPEGLTAWEILQGSIDKLQSDNLKEDIKHQMTVFSNFDGAVNAGKLSPSNMVFVKVQFETGEPQLWLLQQSANYLMVDGKTIDRI